MPFSVGLKYARKTHTSSQPTPESRRRWALPFPLEQFTQTDGETTPLLAANNTLPSALLAPSLFPIEGSKVTPCCVGRDFFLFYVEAFSQSPCKNGQNRDLHRVGWNSSAPAVVGNYPVGRLVCTKSHKNNRGRRHHHQSRRSWVEWEKMLHA